jgi:hypothetical protein
MITAHLYISFWDICLGNLPDGSFARRRIGTDEARQRIERARAGSTLIGLSHDDLLAPYHETARKKHDALRKVLAEHFDIALALADFLCERTDNAGEGPLYTVNSLDPIRIDGDHQLLVVTCAYGLTDEKPQHPLAFEIIPSTVEFILIESLHDHPGHSVVVDTDPQPRHASSLTGSTKSIP